MIDIRTASIYPLATLRGRTAGTATVLTMRKWPRGVSKSMINVWIPDAGPSESLLDLYRRQLIPWNAFAADYRMEQIEGYPTCVFHEYEPMHNGMKQVSTSNPIKRIILLAERYAQYEGYGALTLLCHEQGLEETVNCHRRLLAEMVRQAAMETVPQNS